MAWLRLVGHPLALAGLAAAAGTTPTPLAAAVAGGAVLLGWLSLLPSRLRPWLNGSAWVASVGALALLPDPAVSVASVALAAAGLACLVASLHNGPRDAPPVRLAGVLLMTGAAAAAAAVAWTPALLAQGRRLALQDPLEPTGAALRLAALAALLFVLSVAAAQALSIRLRRPSGTDGSGPDAPTHGD